MKPPIEMKRRPNEDVAKNEDAVKMKMPSK
jgi:hypothetical protein